MINSDKKIQHAYLQLAANSYGILYLNGHKVGDSIDRRGTRSKYWEVTDLLNSNSKNVIAAHVKSYGGRSASANIYLKIEYTDGTTQTIATNPYWKTNTSRQKNWISTDYNDNDWLPAAVVKGPTVYKPQFDYGLPSYVTR